MRVGKVRDILQTIRLRVRFGRDVQGKAWSMVIWNGLGFLVAGVGLGALALTELVSEKITGDDQFYQQHGWVILIGMLVAAAATYGLHRLLLLQKGRVVIDKQTGQELVLRPSHSLFFIPVKWWPAVFAVLGVAFAIAGGAR